ncbi:hypothetical protein [Amycolatopsis benzoatilytica]|uniref:hypothetical protein n=1 Tax=Amycolatopsis benzoatilytica TaxID=346045 RepID=UPI00037D1A52|nr:hypothetical protein [Amycolatopsis benzoatilytica]
MPDGTGPNSGLQRFQNELITPGAQAPPPGSGIIPGANAAAPPPPPPDYKALGTDQAKADFAAASSNGGWKFDPAAMDKVIGQLEDSLDGEYADARTIAGDFAQAGPPGSDTISADYMKAAGRATIAYNQFLRGTVDYLASYVSTLKQIRTAYVNQDHAAIDALRATPKVD